MSLNEFNPKYVKHLSCRTIKKKVFAFQLAITLNMISIIKEAAGEYGSHVDILTIEDLTRFLNTDSNSISRLKTMLNLKNKALSGDQDSFEKLINMKDKSWISLQEMKASQYWFDKFLSSR